MQKKTVQVRGPGNAPRQMFELLLVIAGEPEYVFVIPLSFARGCDQATDVPSDSWEKNPALIGSEARHTKYSKLAPILFC